jgi:hypothetical protein
LNLSPLLWEKSVMSKKSPIVPNACGSPRGAKDYEIEAIDALMCSAQEPTGLSESFCATENHARRLKWLHEKFRYNLLWVMDDDDSLAGMLLARFSHRM